jgi:hypothetical protein
MICDFDDYHETNHRLDLLHQLHDANPLFRCTLFAVPALGSQEFWDATPEWCELAMHGWLHPDPWEAAQWTYEEAVDVLLAAPGGFVEGFKAPGWQISDGTYAAIGALGWWCADHPENNGRRPDGLRAHVYGTGDHWHGHIQDVCGNGLAETFPLLLERVRAAESFELVSEVVAPWALVPV